MTWIYGYLIVGLINCVLCILNGWFEYYKRQTVREMPPMTFIVFYEILIWPEGMLENIRRIFQGGYGDD